MTIHLQTVGYNLRDPFETSAGISEFQVFFESHTLKARELHQFTAQAAIPRPSSTAPWLVICIPCPGHFLRCLLSLLDEILLLYSPTTISAFSSKPEAQ